MIQLFARARENRITCGDAPRPLNRERAKANRLCRRDDWNPHDRENLGIAATSAATFSESERGVALVEMVIVGMLIAIVLAFSLPAIANSIRAYNLRSAAERVAERLAAGRALAMTKNKRVTISLVASSGAYGFDFVPAGAPDGTPDTIDPDDPSQSYFTDTLPSGISFSSITGANNLTNGKAVFYTSRGELPIGAAQADIILSNGRSTMMVSVNLRGQVWVH
jgi:type II secretory pathway pseudopilin PulG